MSEHQIRELLANATDFSRSMVDAHWLADNKVSFAASARPADLFAHGVKSRPLVVGLFGGTGVGKSSLLNRLAGDEIARRGVVRPTSMEITAYLHRDLDLAVLPEGIPRDQFSESRHTNDRFSEVMWVDMPDFDSDEIKNRDLVNQWLPHIDVLLYVVTPERYKDEQGWRMLLENGYRHAWLFVINQWDKASEVQRDDFAQLLAGAGFQMPLLFRTICNQAHHADDDFAELATLVTSLAERNVVAQLDQRGWLHRLNNAHDELNRQMKLLSGAESKLSLRESYEQRWSDFTSLCLARLAVSVREYSAQFEPKKTAPVVTMLKSIRGGDNTAKALQQVASRTDVTAIWDDWSDTRLTDAMSQFNSAEADHGVPGRRLKALTADLPHQVSEEIKSQLRFQLAASLASPGSAWRRSLVKVMSILQLALPALALVWIGYRVVTGFVHGASDEKAYVGVDFLVNGLILAAMAWLVPWLLNKVLVPSIPLSVQTGLNRGLTQALATAGNEFAVQLDLISAERNQLLNQAQAYQRSITAASERSIILKDPDLEKMLLPHPAVK